MTYQSEQSEFVLTDARTTDFGRHVINHGAVIYCLKGTAEVQTNFDRWPIEADNMLTLFPGDTITWLSVSDDFKAEILRYDASLLREASLNIEHAVYRELKADRVCDDKAIARHVGLTMFDMLRYYFGDQSCQSIDRIVTLQINTFFLGFYDYITLEHPHENQHDTSRTEELFRQFMELVEDNYRRWHEVSSYATEMNITRKYLGLIVTRKTGFAPKKLIDEYIVLQLKLRLHSTTMTLKQIASEFNFNDMSFFTRYFKQHTGMTPAAYRIDN